MFDFLFKTACAKVLVLGGLGLMDGAGLGSRSASKHFQGIKKLDMVIGES